MQHVLSVGCMKFFFSKTTSFIKILKTNDLEMFTHRMDGKTQKSHFYYSNEVGSIQK